MEVTFLSSNRDKRNQIENIFQGSPITVNFVDNTYPEIQADSSREIAGYIALRHAAKNNVITIREDHSLYLNDLYPFPGPYAAFYDKYMDINRLLEIYENSDDRTGFFVLEAGLAWPDGEIEYYSTQVPVELAAECSDGPGNLDRVLMLKGENMTFAQRKKKNIPSSDLWAENYKAILRDLVETTGL